MDRLEELEREAQRLEIEATAKLCLMTPSELARKADMAPSTLNRPLNRDKPAKHLVTARTLMKMRAAAARIIAERSPHDQEALTRFVQTPVAMTARERACLQGFRLAEKAVQDSTLMGLGRGDAVKDHPPPGEQRPAYAPAQLEQGRPSRRLQRGAGD